jgi:uncharacterized membrane protein
MTNNKNVPPLKSKLAIIGGIALLVFTPFWFYVGITFDSSWLGVAGLFYGLCSAIVWIIICMGVITYGVLKYSDITK